MTESYFTPSDAREAIRLFRKAVNQIRLLHRSTIPRWSDGITARFADDRPQEDRDEVIIYSDDELQCYREAREVLLRSIELNPYLPDAYFLLGNAYQEIDNDSNSMIRYYDQAILLDPENDEFRNARMSFYLSSGDLDRAQLDLEHLEQLESGYAESMREHFNKIKIGR
ncbi:MAG: hypothetical protein AAGJ40_06380 [Planctomycetota bacterium]